MPSNSPQLPLDQTQLPELQTGFNFPVDSGSFDWQRYYEQQAGGPVPYSNDYIWQMQTAFNDPNWWPSDFAQFYDPNADWSAWGGLQNTPAGGGSILSQVIQGGIDIVGDLITGGGSPASGLATPIISTQTPAPNAPLLGGPCPPGRVLRRVSLGRDKCIKKPHMNVLNPHALSRSTRRVSGFLKRVRNVEKAIRHSMAGTGVIHAKQRRSSGRAGCFTCGARTARSCSCG